MPSLLSRLGNLSAAGTLFSRPVLIFSIVVSAIVIGVRQSQVLEEPELSSFDQLVRLRPDEGLDPRLLVVAVTEEDIQALGKWPTSDQTLDQVLEKLEQYKPRVIGLDIYRDLPMEPGNIELATELQVNDNIVAICKAGNASDRGVAPPATVPENRLGFSDIVVDPDQIVRRSLLFLTPEPKSACPVATNSFSLQLALQYLEKQGVKSKLTPQQYLQVGSTIFKPIEKDTGGYQNIDARGYQVMLNYRSPVAVAQQVTLTDVLKGRINQSLVKDRVVLIGVTATSGNDFFSTPYSSDKQHLRIPGVLVHAQMVSQILSAVLNNRALIWTWPGWGEVAWVWVWSLVGGVLAWRIRHPLVLVVTGGVGLVGLVGICYVILTQGGWVPLVPPALALVAMGASVISYKAYLAGDQRSPIPVTPLPPISVPPRLPDPQLLDRRYKIIEVIATGGFGRTYRAEDTKRPGNPHCVVKQLLPIPKDENFWRIAKRLFNTEAEILQRLGRHDQIAHLLAFFEENGEFYLVEEFIKGSTLSYELTPGKRLGESQVVALLQDVLGILKFIHSQGVIHRDIKPANIIRREPDGRLVLIDFGAVKVFQAALINQQAVEQLQTQITEKQENPPTVAIFTPGYSPPEQLLGKPEFNSDIFALGIIGIQAVTGLVPTQDTVKPEVIWRDSAQKPKVVWQDYAQVSSELTAILDKMVRYHSSERYQSAAEVLQALQDAQ